MSLNPGCLVPVRQLASLVAAAVAIGVSAFEVGATEPLRLGGDAAPTAAWCWFQSPRAIIDDSDRNNPLLLVGAVVCTPTASETHGDVGVLWLNVGSGKTGFAPLHRRLESDDHDSPSLWRRPDGRYVASYSKHCGDRLVRWRVSTHPGDPSEWEPERQIDALGDAPFGDATYTNLHFLPAADNAGGLLYNLSRAVNWDPTVLVSSDAGDTWSFGGKLLTCGDDRTRPYLNYASHGSALHFIATEQHPRQGHTSLWHGYVRNNTLHDSAGEPIDPSVLDAEGVDASQLTPVFQSGDSVGGVTLQRAWGASVAVDNDGAPVVVFSARADDDAHDHRFVYARYDGATWRRYPLAHAGGYLYQAEDDYTGLASIDPNDPGVVFVSTDRDPRTAAVTEHYEIYRGETANGGESWDWSAVTSGSEIDNLRPVVPKWNSRQTAVVWMRGRYHTYQHWDTRAAALILDGDGVPIASPTAVR